MAIDGLKITHHDTDQNGDGKSGEYRAAIPGSSAIGRLIWAAREDGSRVIESTQVPHEIGGRGIAGALVQHLIADARTQGFKIVPRCSYVEAKFNSHPQWADLRA